jgi:bifunctional non-homologous end joining protein LigD
VFLGLRADAGVYDTEAPTERQESGRRIRLGGIELKLSHVDKPYFPDDGITKGDLLEYYRDVADVVVPYLRDRPETLHRQPDGIMAPGFYQKSAPEGLPSWVPTASIESDSRGEAIRYLMCQDAASLLYVVNLGCIELNPALARIGTWDRPDYLVIDLDPDDVGFAKVIEAAVEVRRILDRLEAPSACKTSGKTGLHIYVPLGALYGWEQARTLAELIAGLAHQRLPSTTSVARPPSKRRGRVYLDFLQNVRGQTVAAPYSVRPVPGAWVSAPLDWSEVGPGLDPAAFTLRNMRRRLERRGDLWRKVLGPPLDLRAALERLEGFG